MVRDLTIPYPNYYVTKAIVGEDELNRMLEEHQGTAPYIPFDSATTPGGYINQIRQGISVWTPPPSGLTDLGKDELRIRERSIELTIRMFGVQDDVDPNEFCIMHSKVYDFLKNGTPLSVTNNNLNINE